MTDADKPRTAIAPERKPTRRFLDMWATGDPFRPLEPEVRIVQFGGLHDDADLAKAGALLADRPDVWLRVTRDKSDDLGFLKFFPKLRHLDLDIYGLGSAEGLPYVRDTLESFHFGKTRKTIPLGFLGDLPKLRSLYLAGHKKNIEVVSGLVDLTYLALRGVTLPNLGPLLPLTRLQSLSIAMGATRDLRHLPRFKELETLDLLRITGLSDLSMLPEISGLKSLTLDWMQNVKSLPSFAPLRTLASVEMETMKGLTDLAPIAAAPALRTLQIVNMRQLEAADFACFLGHPALRTLTAAPSSNKVHAEIKKMFPGIAR